MSATIEQSDTIKGASLRTSADMIMLSRRFVVRSVGGSAENRLINADQAPNVPRVGDAYPVITDPRIFVIDKDTKPLNSENTQFEVSCFYQPATSDNQPPDDNGPAVLTIGGSVQSVQTTNNFDGTPIVLERINQENEKDNLPAQPGTITKQIPIFTLIFERHEQNDPTERARKFLANKNLTTFRGFDEGKVLCTRLQGRTENGGQSYQVLYEFQVKDDALGWDRLFFGLFHPTHEIRGVGFYANFKLSDQRHSTFSPFALS